MSISACIFTVVRSLCMNICTSITSCVAETDPFYIATLISRYGDIVKNDHRHCPPWSSSSRCSVGFVLCFNWFVILRILSRIKTYRIAKSYNWVSFLYFWSFSFITLHLRFLRHRVSFSLCFIISFKRGNLDPIYCRVRFSLCVEKKPRFVIVNRVKKIYFKYNREKRNEI